jgi:hypothetical protein
MLRFGMMLTPRPTRFKPYGPPPQLWSQKERSLAAVSAYYGGSHHDRQHARQVVVQLGGNLSDDGTGASSCK